jgi:Bacteriophage T4-like portal protein (Gp20)
MAWWDFYKLWTYQFEKGPLERIGKGEVTGAGVVVPDAMPDLRGDSYSATQTQIRLHDSNDFIDLSTVTNRQSRYKEYERLRSVAEVEMAMTVISDEACVAGSTKISTLFDGPKPIWWLTERWKEDPSPFLVYCWDFDKEDYTLGWAYEPRVVKKAKTVRVMLDDGSSFLVTEDHRILTRGQEWINAGELAKGSELMPFYRLEPNKEVNNLKSGQFPRVFTFDGWKHERQFVDEWRDGKGKYKRLDEACRLLAAGATIRETEKIMGLSWKTIDLLIKKNGFCTKELKLLGERRDRRRVVSVIPHDEVDVYDLSVRDHENFCTDSVVMHNCQKDENGNVFKISVENEEVRKELEFLCFNRKMLNFNRRAWQMVKRLCVFGDAFYELVTNPENPKDGILKIQELPPDSMFKVVTTKGRVVEFQQSKEGPDYQALTRSNVTSATELELRQSTAIRFSANQVVHAYIGDDRRTFYPYGQSLIEPARGPAHQLRLMEDAMMVYRLSRSPERRIFYIDVGQLPPFKAEAFVDRMKDQFRKKKVQTGTGVGANAVDERWHAPAADEDYWVPIRPNANTRIETLPGAQNLGEIDDALYFRNKLFVALNFPKNYLGSEDVGATRITLSAQDARFARMVERIQASMEDAIVEICERHLEMIGFPSESYEDLKVQMTPPSSWKELSEAEIMNNRMNMVTTLKSSMLMSDFDLLTRFMKISEDEAERIISRNKIQKLEDLKIQIIGQNPQLLGVGTPGSEQGENEMGVEPGGPTANLGSEGETPESPEGQEQETQEPEAQKSKSESSPLPDPTEEEIKKYDLGMEDYSRNVDREEIDWSEEN